MCEQCSFARLAKRVLEETLQRMPQQQDCTEALPGNRSLKNTLKAEKECKPRLNSSIELRSPPGHALGSDVVGNGDSKGHE
mmetsp:Transcript_34778/g.75832  ORF Transcript_34778/g.75832 Transcript_34778/m.75832 type:complete len:81 (+) Transcript_34778:186-428(+)